MSCAIDFTSSNGEMTEPRSLHYISESNQELNSYEKAITQVGTILDFNSETKEYFAYGFGGKARGDPNA